MYTTVQRYIPEEVLNGRLKTMHRERLDVAEYYRSIKEKINTFDPSKVPSHLISEQLEYLTHCLNSAEKQMTNRVEGSRLYKFYISLQMTITPQYLSLLERHLPHLFDDTVMEGLYYAKIHNQDCYQPGFYWRKLSFYLRGFNRNLKDIYNLYKSWYQNYSDKSAEYFHDYIGLFTQMAKYTPTKVPLRVINELDNLRYGISGYYVTEHGFDRVEPVNVKHDVKHHTGKVFKIEYQRIRLNYIFDKPQKDDRPAFLGDYVMKESQPTLSLKPKKEVKVVVKKKSRRLTKEQLNELRENLGIL